MTWLHFNWPAGYEANILWSCLRLPEWRWHGEHKLLALVQTSLLFVMVMKMMMMAAAHLRLSKWTWTKMKLSSLISSISLVWYQFHTWCANTTSHTLATIRVIAVGIVDPARLLLPDFRSYRTATVKIFTWKGIRLWMNMPLLLYSRWRALDKWSRYPWNVRGKVAVVRKK